MTLRGTVVIFSVCSKSLAWYKSEGIAKVFGKDQGAGWCVMKDCSVEHIIFQQRFPSSGCVVILTVG